MTEITLPQEQPVIKDTQRMMTIIVILMLGRLIVNMGRRFAYPFLPAISRQLGVPLASVQNVMAVQAGIGITTPLFGPYIERFGRKRTMMFSLTVMVIAGIIGAAFPQFWVFAVVMVGFGFAKLLYDPSLVAYVGDRIPFNRRGFALGITELSWAGALLVASPIVGVLFGLSLLNPVGEFLLEDLTGLANVPGLLRSSIGLQLVFAGLSVLSFIALVVITFVIPPDHPDKDTTTQMITPLDSWRVLRHHPAALASIGYMMMISIANEVFFINYGLWMEQSFGLLLAALGIAATVIAAAEILGEVTVITIADRIGPRRLALIGSGFAALTYVILPTLTFSLGVALAGVFTMFLFVEISIVAAIPLFTEVLPENRAILMAGVVGGASFGRLSGAILGGVLLALLDNFLLIGVVSMVIGLIAFFLMWRFIRIEA